MITKILFLAKKENSNLYIGVFEAGNGGAWNDIYELSKRANSIEEAMEWAKNLVINSKWRLQSKSFSDLEILPKATFNPSLAGQDELIGKEVYYLIDNGFEISFTCNKKKEKGCFLKYNTGTRNNPIWGNKFFKLNPKQSFYCSHRAGRSSKETLYLEKVKNGWQLIIVNKGGYKSELIYDPECFKILGSEE